MKSKIVYWLTYAGMWLVALLPFRALYALSDGLYFLMRHVVHYRKKVVRRNLRNSFPEKSETELMEIERKFYHYICDYMLEEVKMLRMSFEELCRRMKYDNKEEYLAMIEKHGGIVLLIPHYANFEWIIGMGAIMHPGDIPVQVYKPLSNKYLDEMFKHIRARFGGYNVAKHSTAREVIKLRREGRRIAIGLITDQSPNRSEAHYWTTFLNQDTVNVKDGVKLYDANGNDVTANVQGTQFSAKATTGALTLSLHVGADATSNNQISLDITAMSAERLGVAGLKVDGSDDTNALKAIDTIKESIQKVSTQRSALGAVQNRLEHTINNLDNVVENTTSAESQIRDTDMATEMVKYSNNNILAQAGQAMLAQANQSNQGVLSLLQ